MTVEKLAGKAAIVTGAAQGMGRIIAQALADEGASVTFSDINPHVKEALPGSGRHLAFQADVANPREVDDMVRATLNRFGRIDILVNNAGILRTSRIDDISKEEWDLVLDVNLNGVFNCTTAVLDSMRQNHFGRIINMSSSAGRSVSTLGGAHYTTSKAAVLGFTRAVAKEVGGWGITVNAICPGLIDTDMVRLECSPQQLTSYEKSFPIPRLGTPQEVAKLVLYLVTDAAYTTGAAFDINGGDLMI